MPKPTSLESTNKIKKRGLGRRSCSDRVEFPSSSLSLLSLPLHRLPRHWTMLSAQVVSTARGFVVDVSDPFFFPSWFWLGEQCFTIQERSCAAGAPAFHREGIVGSLAFCGLEASHSMCWRGGRVFTLLSWPKSALINNIQRNKHSSMTADRPLLPAFCSRCHPPLPGPGNRGDQHHLPSTLGAPQKQRKCPELPNSFVAILEIISAPRSYQEARKGSQGESNWVTTEQCCWNKLPAFPSVSPFLRLWLRGFCLYQNFSTLIYPVKSMRQVIQVKAKHSQIQKKKSAVQYHWRNSRQALSL